jgi:hypothetical protein
MPKLASGLHYRNTVTAERSYPQRRNWVSQTNGRVWDTIFSPVFRISLKWIGI